MRAMDAAAQSPAVQDSGLRCPGCGYNLTGLSEARCPECGATFDWDVVRRAAEDRPRIAFEAAAGWRKLPALLLTWLTVLIAPWVFARQAVARIDGWHALAFVAFCFASTLPCFAFDADLPVWGAWLTTAALCIGVQSAWLAFLDPHGWRSPAESLRFWLLAGCYTSTVMATEFAYGPPLLDFSGLVQFLTSGPSSSYGLSPLVWWEFNPFVPQEPSWILQLALWLTALACVYFARLRRARVARGRALAVAVLVWLLLLVQYAVLVEHVGMRLWGLFGGRIG
jgi:hypothetical protein